MVITGALVLCYLMNSILPELHVAFYGVVLLIPVLVASPYLKFIKEPNSELPDKIEAASGVALLLSYVILTTAIITESGLTWV